MSSAKGRLVLVPTPLGNLDDITLRAISVLKSADILAAEDTRKTGRLLVHLGLKVPMMSYHEHNEVQRSARIADLLAEGRTVALVTDAGMPGLSDPGYRAVQAALEGDFAVEVLPGPSAILPALIGSGLPCDRFCFEGYLPRKDGARRRAFAALADEERTTIWFESPHRLVKSLLALADSLPNRPAVVARELTKIHEEFRRGLPADLAAHYGDRPPKGEIVLLVGGLKAKLPGIGGHLDSAQSP